MGLRLLLVDDDANLTRLLEAQLRQRGHAVHGFTSPKAALAELDKLDLDVVITDLEMKELDGFALCREVLERRPLLPVVVLTAHAEFGHAVQAIRAGAYDFVTKPPDLDALELVLTRAVQHKLLREEVRRLREAVAGSRKLGGLVGASAPMKALFELIERVAPSPSGVLVAGESGTGKELVAQALHQRSPRAKGPFLAVDCASVPEDRLEDELFGHVKGALPEARSDRAGLFQQAAGGTLFLDEVGALPAATQARLLRALQERAVRRVGGERDEPVDVRVVASTSRDLEAQVEAGSFRKDLFFQLNVIAVELPPLRARGSDVLLLAQHFVEKFAAQANRPVTGISAKAGEKLLEYAWPGNVRELSNCVERAVALARYDKLSVEDLPERVRKYKASHVVVAANDPSELVTIDVLERRYIERVMEAVGGNKSHAAKILGLDRTTLYRKLDRYAAKPGPEPEG